MVLSALGDGEVEVHSTFSGHCCLVLQDRLLTSDTAARPSALPPESHSFLGYRMVRPASSLLPKADTSRS